MSLKDALKQAILGFSSHFEMQRRNIGKAYQLGNEIRTASKRGIAAIEDGFEALTLLQNCRLAMERNWEELMSLNLPGDLAWKFESENGQEMAEFEIVCALCPFLQGELNEHFEIPSCVKLKVSPQTWLAGLGDAVGELSKMLLRNLCKEDLSRPERLAMRKQFVKIAKQIREVLDEFETAYPMVINNSRRRGFGNTFRGLLVRIDHLIAREQEAIAAILDHS